MLSKQTSKYIEKVLKEGYPSKQVEEVLIKKGYDKKEVQEAIENSLKKTSKGFGIVKKIEDAMHIEILSKSDKVIASFAEKMLRKKYYADQIQKTLVQDGYDETRVEKIIEIVQKKLRREEVLHSVFETVKHEEEVIKEEYQILHHEWLKLGIVAGIILTGIFAMLFYNHLISDSIVVIEAISLLIALLVALPAGAFCMHHLSLYMHKKEIYFRYAIGYLSIIGVMLLITKVLFPIWVMLFMLVLLVYFLTHNIVRHYDYPYIKALVLSGTTIGISFVTAYVIMAAIGLIIGFYTYMV